MITNHPAHGPVSLDRLHQISEILSKAAAQSDGGNLGYAMADAVKVIDGAIAAFGADPVTVNDDMAYAFNHALSDSSLGSDEVEEIKTGLRAAFANVSAQPAPVVPETLPCPVHLEPGLKFGKGVRTQCVLDALRRRADYYAELEAMTPEQLAEHDAGIAEFKAMLGTSKRDSFKMPEELLSAMEEVLRISDRDHEAWHKARNGIASCRAAMLQAGNSPVIPDRRVSNKVRENGFGYLSVSQGNYGKLRVHYDRFIFDQGSAPENGKFIPKHMLQGIINRLQEHCDELGEEALIDIFEGLRHREEVK